MGWVAFFTFLTLAFVMAFILLLTDSESTVQKTQYEVRFEPSNNKYYIVKIQGTKEERITGKFGLCTIYYEDMVLADLVLQRLTNVNSGNNESK